MLRIACILALASFSLAAEPQSRPTTRACQVVEERLTDLPPRQDLMDFPADGRHWAVVAFSGEKCSIILDGKPSPEYAGTILPAAIGSMHKAISPYNPDGAWPERPGYWDYATRYTVYGIAALQSARGTELGLEIRRAGSVRAFPVDDDRTHGTSLQFCGYRRE